MDPEGPFPYSRDATAGRCSESDEHLTPFFL